MALARIVILFTLLVAASGCKMLTDSLPGIGQDRVAGDLGFAGQRVPDLPFPDNPDPLKCGIPTRWGTQEPAWLSGVYRERLVQPVVLLYDSHRRERVTGAAPTGTEVEVLLYQSNPVLDYYLVRTVDIDPPQEGWVPGPFLRFEPLSK